MSLGCQKEFSYGSCKVLDESGNIDYELLGKGVSLKGNTYWCAPDIARTHKR
ncbi:predicted protein [Arabidopsis lyrata subsp. lyrata]|uniref:Predicted protein n=1 Tax=Arabidopsis lyrata subsp. lyrata TaxID=81972 RepID=D7MKA9_ARALL|nr:predicted protein [Arabidopsis lyrata subsp. lyrata]